MKYLDAKHKMRALLLMALGAALAVAVFIIPTVSQQQGGDLQLKELGLAEFAQTEMTYDGVMHELYWHYEFANQMIRVNRIDDAKAHLKMIPFYVNLLPYLSRDKKFFKDPEAVKKFDAYAQDLIAIIEKINKTLGSGSPDEAGRELEKRVNYICFHCHKELKAPIRDITPYGKKIEMSPSTAPTERRRIHQ